MSGITKILADNMRRLRKERNLTQTELAELVDVSLTTIQGYESLRTWPSPENITNLAKALKVSEPELFRDPEFKPELASVLSEFGRLLGKANPIAIEHALKILAEIGQPAESPAVAQPRRRTAKS